MVELTKEDLKRQTVSRMVACLETDTTYTLEDLINQYGEGLSFHIEVEWDYDDCSVYPRLSIDRLETDEEYEARLEQLRVYRAKQAAAAEKRRKTREAKKLATMSEERKLYETLKAKFEGKG